MCPQCLLPRKISAKDWEAAEFLSLFTGMFRFDPEMGPDRNLLTCF